MINPVLNAKPISALAARLSVISGVIFVIILGSLHFLEPEFDPTWRFISEYALGNFGWLMHLAFGLLAVSLISAGIVILSQARNITGYIGLVILGLSAIGIIIAAIFVTDPISVTPDDATFSGKMHSIGATLDYTPVAALLISFALARNEAWKVIRVRLFVTAGITIIIMALFILQIPHDGQFGPNVLAGLFGRILIVSYLGWILIVGTHALKLRRQNPKV
ncbi:DUF998 domain-containing protein [Paenibacillus harenae]|uniref:DUF998 domain-containing protein n=1 Tax=Paenibacillus harenae TaxID=306543 RepID=A0ABT9U7R6_PAEHA|nr:DUF998 domain-containing protein [Paenibacillus harenae]MDQ0115608.1 hypothetical protein [Paenibacillus harenae]